MGANLRMILRIMRLVGIAMGLGWETLRLAEMTLRLVRDRTETGWHGIEPC